MTSKDKQHLVVAYSFCKDSLDVIIEGHLKDINKYSKKMFNLSNKPYNKRPASQKNAFHSKVFIELENKIKSSQEALTIALWTYRR